MHYLGGWGGHWHYHQCEDETAVLAHLYTRFQKLERYRLLRENLR